MLSIARLSRRRTSSVSWRASRARAEQTKAPERERDRLAGVRHGDRGHAAQVVAGEARCEELHVLARTPSLIPPWKVRTRSSASSSPIARARTRRR